MSDSILMELKRRNVFKVGVGYLVLAWLVIQITATAVPALNMPDWVNTVVFFFGLIGFPFALFFSWAFELTPDGVKRESEVNRDTSITNQTGRMLNYSIIALLTLALAYFIWESQLNRNEHTVAIVSPANKTDNKNTNVKQELNPASIAVLAFADLSPKSDQEYFSDGISEEILNVLVKVDKLNVSSRTSSFQFKNADLGIPEIAKRLKVRHVVEGSVRKAGNTIRITAQLIDAENDRHLWSETYDRPLDAENLFAIQDEIANSIVAALSDVLGVVDQHDFGISASTTNVTAYELFLEARSLFQSRMSLDKADNLLAKALELDANYSKAWEIRSALQTLMIEYGYSDIDITEAEKLTRQFAQKAIEINPDSSTAIAVLAKIRDNAVTDLRAQFDLAKILDDYGRAITIEPNNASALNWRGLTHLLIGNLDLALSDFKKCINYEPFYEPCVENYIAVVSYIKDDQEALDVYRDALDAGIGKIQYASYTLLIRTGEELAFKSATNHPRVLHGWHRHDELYQAMLSPEEDHQELITDILRFVAEKKDRDIMTINWLLIPIGYHNATDLLGIQWDKSTTSYRQSPQFTHYIKKTGVFDYWKKYGFPPQCKPVGDDDFICTHLGDSE